MAFVQSSFLRDDVDSVQRIWETLHVVSLVPALIFLPLFPPTLSNLFICDYSSFVLARLSPFTSFSSSIPLSFSPSVYVPVSILARASLFPLLVLGQPPLSSVLVHPHRAPQTRPTFLFLLFLFPFCMCAIVWGARHSVQPSGLKVNTYVIANCLQSLGAALKKDMLCRQLRPLAFASLSDRICFKGLVYLTPEQCVYCWWWGNR